MTILIVGHSYLAPVNLARLERMAQLRPTWDLAVVVPEEWLHPTLGLTYQPPSSPLLRIIPVRTSNSHRSSAYRFAVRDLTRALRSLRPTHVHIEQEPFSAAAFQLAIWCRLRSVPWSVFSWENLPRRYGLIRRWCARFVLRGSTIAVGGTHEAATQLRRNGAKHVEVVPQFGVNTGQFAPRHPQQTQDASRLRVGYVGRLVQEKGVDIAVRAVASSSLAGATLTIVGAGPDEARLRRLANRRAPGTVRFRPPVGHLEVAEVLRELDVLVLPSRCTPTWAEQFGRILIEAMASGVVPVGARTGAIPEVIGAAGLTFPVGNVAGLQAALLALSDQTALSTHSVAARRRALTVYSNDAIARRWVAIFDRLPCGQWSCRDS